MNNDANSKRLVNIERQLTQKQWAIRQADEMRRYASQEDFLKAIGKGRDGQRFDCATWLHKARELPKEEFKREVSKHLTGKETEPWEILYFKAYKSQLPVIVHALETAGLLLGSDKSRGYCLEMICADFLAGVSLEAGNRDALLASLTRLVIGLPKPERKQLLEEVLVTF